MSGQSPNLSKLRKDIIAHLKSKGEVITLPKAKSNQLGLEIVDSGVNAVMGEKKYFPAKKSSEFNPGDHDDIFAERSLPKRKVRFDMELNELEMQLSRVSFSDNSNSSGLASDRFQISKDRNGNIWIFIQTAVGNVFDLTSLEELTKTLRRLQASDIFQTAKIIYFSHKDENFSLGGDRRFFSQQVRDGAGASMEMVCAAYRETLDVLADLKCITVGVAYGNALGGGMELLMALDFQIVWPGIKVGFPEARSGLFAGMGGCSYLASIIGIPLAMRMNIQGEIIGSQRACELGILTHLSPRPYETALEFLKNIPDYLAALEIKKIFLHKKHEYLKADMDRWSKFVGDGDFLAKESKIISDFGVIERVVSSSSS